MVGRTCRTVSYSPTRPRRGRANRFREGWKRYEFGVALVESKRWMRPLDRQSGHRGEETAPSTQMLRYPASSRRPDHRPPLRWGCLTNGAPLAALLSGRPARSRAVLRDRPWPPCSTSGGTTMGRSPCHHRIADTGSGSSRSCSVERPFCRRRSIREPSTSARSTRADSTDSGWLANLSTSCFGQVFPDLTEGDCRRPPRGAPGGRSRAAIGAAPIRMQY